MRKKKKSSKSITSLVLGAHFEYRCQWATVTPSIFKHVNCKVMVGILNFCASNDENETSLF